MYLKKHLKQFTYVLLIFACVLTAVTAGRENVFAQDYSSYSAQKVGWGLSRNGHETPAGTYPYQGFSMEKYSACYVGDTSRKVMYFTFDCGYENGYTAKILDTLKQYKVKAIFFVTKPYVVQNPDLVKRMKEEGHLVGNHTSTHSSLPSKSAEQVKEEVKGVEAAMQEYTGYTLDKYLRPPMGEYSVRTLKILKDMGYRTVFWSLAWQDWDVNNQPSVESVISRFEQSYHKGMIPLIHNTSSADTKALPGIIAYMQSLGYSFERLDDYFRPVPKLTVRVKNRAYNGKTPAIKVKTKSDGKITYTYYNESKKKLKKKPIDAGTYYIEVKLAETENYKAASKKVKFKIQKVKPKVKLSIPRKIAEGDDYQPEIITVNKTAASIVAYYNEDGERIHKPSKPGVYYAAAFVAASKNYKKAHSDRIKFRIKEASINQIIRNGSLIEDNVILKFIAKTGKLYVGEELDFAVNISEAVWNSSKKEVASISDQGRVKALKCGKTRITAKAAGQKVSALLTVAAKDVEITPSVSELRAGSSLFFKANLEGVAWSSSNEDVAGVSEKGQVVALKRGSTVITASKDGKKASVKLTVTPKKVIGVDAGHQLHAASGVAAGTTGVATRKPEYKLTLEIALKLQEELENRGYEVVMTRTTNNVNISNKDRALQFNKRCDIAIHIHGDGSGRQQASGASAHYIASSGSKKFARALLKAYCAETGIRSRSNWHREDLTCLKYSTIPSVLIELGFMTNPAEDTFMSSKAGQEEMVNGLANGVDNYFYGGSYGVLISR